VELQPVMTKHAFPEEFKSPYKPRKVWPFISDHDVGGYLIGDRVLFKAIAIIDDMHILLGTFVGRAAACRLE
jgi:hypothetical protein